MGHVDIDDAGRLQITLANHEDRAALRAAHRCAVDPDPLEVPSGSGTSSVALDADHIEHILIAWACGFTWSESALKRAVDELAPYARQSTAMHSSTKLKSHKRWIDKMAKERPANRGSGESSSRSPS